MTARPSDRTADTGSEPAAGPAVIAAGGCYAWPLPLDATCAAQARRAYREAAGVAGLPDELAYDGMTMASELAANTLHANAHVEVDAAARGAVAGGPEIWIYLRQHAARWELVCKVYDSLSGWKRGTDPPAGDGAPLDAVDGRGLQVVAGLSGGRWGHHLTRSRFGSWKVPGKAVWFAQPVPAGCGPAGLGRRLRSSADAARALERLLAARELGSSLLRIEERGQGMSVLSVRCGLTLWCGRDVIWWSSGIDGYERRSAADLEEVCEQVVRICQEMDRDTGSGLPGVSRPR